MFFGLDPLYFALALPGLLLGMWAQSKVSRAFRRYSQVPTARGETGAEVAASILRARGVTGVSIEPVSGKLSDHYDPSTKTLRLSQEVYGGRSVAAAGVAAHEVGHALQHADGYAWLTMRSKLVPVLSITSKAAMPLIMLGFFLMWIGSFVLGQLAVQVGAILFAGIVVFQLVTLPVEFDASKRALAVLGRRKLLTGHEGRGAKAVLDAAALTYVAAAVSSVLTLVYFLLRAGLLSGDD